MAKITPMSYNAVENSWTISFTSLSFISKLSMGETAFVTCMLIKLTAIPWSFKAKISTSSDLRLDEVA